MQEAWKRILVATDLSPSSELAMTKAVPVAEALRARIDLAYMHQPLVSPVPEMMLNPPDETVAIAEVTAQLREIAARFAGRVPVEVHVRIAEPVAGLLQLVDELSPDLLVVGSHGRGAVMRVLLGSVAEQLCRRSPVPVLVIPAPERVAAAKQKTAA